MNPVKYIQLFFFHKLPLQPRSDNVYKILLRAYPGPYKFPMKYGNLDIKDQVLVFVYKAVFNFDQCCGINLRYNKI